MEKNGFKSYEDFDPRVGDCAISRHDLTDHGWHPYSTVMVLGFEKVEKYEPIIWLGRVHCHVDEIMSSVRCSQMAMQIETFSVSLSSFKKNYLGFTRGRSGQVDNRNRHSDLSYPAWWDQASKKGVKVAL